MHKSAIFKQWRQFQIGPIGVHFQQNRTRSNLGLDRNTKGARCGAPFVKPKVSGHCDAPLRTDDSPARNRSHSGVALAGWSVGIYLISSLVAEIVYRGPAAFLVVIDLCITNPVNDLFIIDRKQFAIAHMIHNLRRIVVVDVVVAEVVRRKTSRHWPDK
jgi:hypothetical protein